MFLRIWFPNLQLLEKLMLYFTWGTISLKWPFQGIWKVHVLNYSFKPWHVISSRWTLLFLADFFLCPHFFWFIRFFFLSIEHFLTGIFWYLSKWMKIRKRMVNSCLIALDFSLYSKICLSGSKCSHISKQPDH